MTVTGANPNRSPLVQLYWYVEKVPFQAASRVYHALPTWVRLQEAEVVLVRAQWFILLFVAGLVSGCCWGNSKKGEGYMVWSGP